MSAPAIDVPKSRELLEGLLTIPGSTGETYRRFWNYSPRNIGFLAMQGCPPAPVATYNKWKELGFHVRKGEKAYSILRPINIRVAAPEGSDEEFSVIKRFKVVRALFHHGQVAGEAELPPYEPRSWDVEQALTTLGIERVPFQSYQGNIGGYAIAKTIAINPVAPYPFRTTLHEISHVQHGHTTSDNILQYQEHRGQFEFEAEASAYVCLNELGELDDSAVSHSRGYVQGWLQDQRPSEASLRQVLTVSTQVLDAGYGGRAEG